MIRMLVVSAFLVACGSAPPPAGHAPSGAQGRVEAEVDDWIAAHSAAPLEITITEGALRTHCPVGVRCDEHFEYWAVEGGSPTVYVSFEASVLRDPSLTSLRQHFQYVGYTIPVMSRGSWEVVLERDGVSRREAGEVTIDSYDGQRLELTLRAVAHRIDAVDRDEQACPRMMDAPLADECFFHRDVTIPIVLRVALPMTIAPLDCTDARADSGPCG